MGNTPSLEGEDKDKYIEEPYPAWTAIGVSELAFLDALLEIRVNARIG